MKKTLLLLQLCIVTAIPLTSYGQTTDNNKSTFLNENIKIEQLQDSISNLIISTDAIKALYANFQNPISIYIPGVPSPNIQVEATNVKEIRHDKNYTWYIVPKEENLNCIITVSIKNIDGTVQKVESKEFRVIPLPNPRLYIEYSKDGRINRCYLDKSITNEELMNAEDVKLKASIDILGVDYIIESFIVKSIDNITGNTVRLNSSQCYFTSAQLRMIKKLEPGKSFLIIKIDAIDPDGINYKIPSIVVDIKGDDDEW